MPRTRGCDKQLGSNSFRNGFDLVRMLRFYLGTTKPEKKNKQRKLNKNKIVRIAKPMQRTRGCDKQLGSNSFHNGFDLVWMLVI